VRVGLPILAACVVILSGCGPTARETPADLSPADPGLIVFTGYQPDREASGFEFWAMRPDGSVLRRLAPAPFDDLSFSPGGGFIVTFTVVETAGDSQDLISVSRPDGSERRRVPLPNPSGTSGWPSVSPDGKRVAFVYARDPAFTGPRNLWTVSVGDDDFKQLSSTGEVQINGWSPDGEHIAFMNGEMEDIYVVRADGTELHHVAHGGEPAWSPDGKRIAFSDRGQISVVDSSGGAPMVVSSNGQMPAWSPDGKQLAFLHGKPCGEVMCNRVFIVDVGGGRPRPVGPQLYEAGYLAWTTARVPPFEGSKTGSPVTAR
jgi:Tol biopolymer transport system component